MEYKRISNSVDMLSFEFTCPFCSKKYIVEKVWNIERMEIFQIDENLYQSSIIDDAERAKMFDICIDLAGGIDPDASDFKIYLTSYSIMIEGG